MKTSLCTLATLCAVASFSLGNELSKAESTGQILDALQRIYAIARSPDPTTSRQEVRAAISHLKSIDQLATFAVLARNIAHPQAAGDEKVDLLFSDAFWQAAEIISQDRSPEGKAGLQEIRQRVRLDGGDNILFNDLTLRQSR